MIENKFYDIGDKNITIALITDLHFDENYDISLLEKIIENIKQNKPNYICLSGDILDRADIIYNDCMITLKDFVKKLSLVSNTIVTLGNHDLSNKHKKGNFLDVNNWFLTLNTIENVYYLNNKSLVRDKICFTSYNPNFEYYERLRGKEQLEYFVNDIDKQIKMYKKYYNILLCHSPIDTLKKETIKRSKEIKKADLILSGHMHNGLVLKIFDKRGNRGFIGPYYKMFPKTARGKIEKIVDNKKITLIINGGIIKVSDCNGRILKKLNNLYPANITIVKI